MSVGIQNTELCGNVAGLGGVYSHSATGNRKDPGQYSVAAPADVASYVVSFNVSVVAALDIFAIGTPDSMVTRLRRIVLVNPGIATGSTTLDLVLGIASGTGSGGSAATVAILDGVAHPAGVFGGPDSGGTARTGDTSQAGGFTAMYNPLVTVSIPATAGGFTPQVLYDAMDPLMKCVMTMPRWWIILRAPSSIGAGASGFRGYAEFTIDVA